MSRKQKGLYKRGKIWWMSFVDEYGKQKWVSTKTQSKVEAEYILGKVRTNIKEGKGLEILRQVKQSQKHTLGALALKYMEFSQSQKGYVKKRSVIKLLIQEIGNQLLSTISLMKLELYQSELLSKGLKPATVNRRIGTLKHMFNKANDWGMMTDEQAQKLNKIKLLKENNKRLKYLSSEECRALLNACPDYIKPIVITAINTGMRKSEIFNLKWENVDMKHGFIKLNPEETKSGKGREIPINQHMEKVLTYQDSNRYDDSDYVFCSPVTCKPFKDIKRSFTSACNEAGIRGFRFHDLRHTFASQLVMAGAELASVQKLLGHATINMTMRYSHLSPDHLKLAVDKLNDLI